MGGLLTSKKRVVINTKVIRRVRLGKIVGKDRVRLTEKNLKPLGENFQHAQFTVSSEASVKVSFHFSGIFAVTSWFKFFL